VTRRLELMVAVRPTFHAPALLAKQAANIDRISGGRLSLNVVSSWWATEARKYGVRFDRHDERYARTDEWLQVVNGLWQSERFSFSGRYYEIDQGILEPGPVQQPRPTIYAGGESPAGKDLISRTCDGWLTHGDPPGVIGGKVAEMTRRRRGLGLEPMRYGAAGYAVVRPTEAEARAALAAEQLVRAAQEGSVALFAHGWFNRMLRPELKSRGWVCVRDGGDDYWSWRRYEFKAMSGRDDG
jgi:dimethylsulfone monooxygenase